MSSKYLILGLGLAAVLLIALTRCGSSEAPVKVANPPKTSVSGSFSSQSTAPAVQAAPAAQAAAQPAAPPSSDQPGVPMGVVPPGQTVPVGIPQPGGVAFGPAPLTGAHGEEERQQMMEQTAKEAELKSKRAGAQQTPPPASTTDTATRKQ